MDEPGTQAPQPDPQPEPQPQPEPTPQPQPQPPANAGILPTNPDTLPISDWSKVDLGLAKDAQVDADLLASFGENVAVKLGLTPAQAKGAVQWQLQAMTAAREQYRDAQTQALKQAWGRNMEANGSRVFNMITTIDRKLGNESFSQALAASGALDNAQVICGLLELAKLIGEDSTGSGAPNTTGTAVETAEEGIEAAYKAVRNGRP